MPAVALPLAAAAVPIAGPLVAALIAAVPAAVRYVGAPATNRAGVGVGLVGAATRWVPSVALFVATAACARIPDDATLAIAGTTLAVGPIARANAVLACGTAALVALYGVFSTRGAALGIASAVIAASVVVAAFAGDVARVGAAGIHVAMMVAAISMTLGERGGSAASAPGWRAAAAYLTLGSLGLVTIVAGLSLADVLRVSPGGLVTESFVIAVLAAGFALAIGLPPLHFWVPVVAWRPSAGSAALALGVVVPAAVGYLMQVLAGVPQLGGATLTARLLTVGGMVACAVGAIGAVSPGRLGRRVGYAAIAGIGPVLLGLGTGTRIGVAGAMVALAHHAVCTITLIASAPAVEHHRFRDVASSTAEPHTPRTTVGRSSPWPRVAFMLAAVAASGIPPLGGFASRWAIMQALSLADWRLGMAVGVTSLVTLAALLSGVARTHEVARTQEVAERVGDGGRLLVVYAVATCVWGVAPQWVIEHAWRATVQMGFLRPF